MHAPVRASAEAYRRQFRLDPTVLANAPGRVNLIGEHTDYNDGFVLPIAIDRWVAVAMGAGTGDLYSVDYQEHRRLGDHDGSWADYPRGVAWAMGEISSFQATFSGNVPRGAGLSSSAAIEASTALALDALLDQHLSRPDLALLCQRAENQFVGVQSGIMDQYASLLCRKGHALLLDCRSLETSQVPLDLDACGLELVVCDTRVERTLAGSAYNDRRASTEAAARALGWNSLRDASEADLARLDGEMLRRARHVVTENARVLKAVEALQQADFPIFGQLMYASHASLRDDYQVSIPQLDAFVETAREAGALGARLTGAGFGGCAIALIDRDRVSALERMANQRFRDQGFNPPSIYPVRSVDGAEIVS